MGKGKASPSNIDIYLRLRPVDRDSRNIDFDPIENTIQFHHNKDTQLGYVNNQRENYEFKFTGILGPDAKQDEVRNFRRKNELLLLPSIS